MDITLNIHYTIPRDLWDRLDPHLTELKTHGIFCSVEPGGLQLYDDTESMTREEFDRRVGEFCKQASEIVGFPVGNACGDFPCVPFR